MKVPDNLLSESGSFYIENEKIYQASFNCVPALEKYNELAGTWGCFYAKELKQDVQGSWRYKPWPQEAGIKLGDIPDNGIIIPDQEYVTNQELYDSFLRWDSNLFFLEGNYLYQRLHLILE